VISLVEEHFEKKYHCVELDVSFRKPIFLGSTPQINVMSVPSGIDGATKLLFTVRSNSGSDVCTNGYVLVK